jgi:hypothetical protein
VPSLRQWFPEVVLFARLRDGPQHQDEAFGKEVLACV